jgi:hypothetical protein
MINVQVTGSAEINKMFKTDNEALKFLRDLKKQVSNGGLKIKVWDDKNIFNTVNTTTTMQTANLLIELIRNSKELNKAKTLNTILNDNGIDMSVRGLRSKGYNETHVWTRTPAMEKYLIAEGVTHEKVTDAVEKFQYAIDNPPAPYIPQAPKVTTTPAPTIKVPEVTTAPTTDKDIEEAANKVKENIIKMMQELTPKGSAADMEEVKKLIHESEEKTSVEMEEVYTYVRNKSEELKAIILANVKTETVYVTPNVPAGVKIEGMQHMQFKELLEMTVALRPENLYPWITGGAGGGKTHSAKQVAEALNVKFRSLSVCAQTTAAAIYGYQNAAGTYISTTFRDCYENGGLFCLDEIDNGNANVLAALNSALSNGHASFPDGQVEMNKDFYLIATANTTGNGATKKFVGRNPIDGATKDRFQYIHWSYDPNIELNVMAKGNKEIYSRIKALRDTAEHKGLECIISPRATAGVNALINIGWTMNKAINAAITEKLTPQEKSALSL